MNDSHPNGPPTGQLEGPDPFDPARLRLSQDFATTVGVKKLLTMVPVRKPANEWFIRTHPDPEYRIQTAVLELKEERETYLVDRDLWQSLATEPTFIAKMLITAMNRQGTVFIWPIRLPGPDGKLDDWNRSALVAAEEAKKSWVRVAANMNLGAYDIWQAEAELASPTWPEISFQELLRTAFKDKTIQSHDHPVLQKLRGKR
jgi:hypothetical protein